MKIYSALYSDLRKNAYFCLKKLPSFHLRDLCTMGFIRILGQKYKIS